MLESHVWLFSKVDWKTYLMTFSVAFYGHRRRCSSQGAKADLDNLGILTSCNSFLQRCTSKILRLDEIGQVYSHTKRDQSPSKLDWIVHICLGGGFKHFLFSPRKLGKISILTNIFQMGWNHQPVVIYPMTLLLASPFFLQKPSGVAEVVGGGALAGGVSSSRTVFFFWS